MKTYYITFRSVTFAQRGEHVLKNEGISCALQRASRAIEERGCGYSLVLRQPEVLRAVEALRSSQIPFKRVYSKEQDGRLAEVSL